MCVLWCVCVFERGEGGGVHPQQVMCEKRGRVGSVSWFVSVKAGMCHTAYSYNTPYRI